MNLLAIDTSNDVLGVALLTEEKVIAEYSTNLKKNHSVRLMPAVEQLLADCGLKPSDLDKIVVAQGPGSYTGVRIGVTVAKTMAWALGVPLSGVSSLAALAASARRVPGVICPLFDARRERLYTGLYRYEGDHLMAVIPDQNISAADWADILIEQGEPVYFIGNDVPLYRDLFTEKLGDLAAFASVAESNPRPGELGWLGMEAPAEVVHAFSPNYTRLVEAEAKWLEEQGKNK